MTAATIQNALISVSPDGMIRGTFPPDAAFPTPVTVDVMYNGDRWASVPVLAAGLDGPDPSFSCRLPPVQSMGTASVAVLDSDRRTLLFNAARVERQPLFNGTGLSAASVYGSVERPMFAVPWIRFDGVNLIISGSHLPPDGDPSRLSVSMPAGVAFDFNYPLPGPEWGAHFWYWPNAHHSSFILTINLAESDWGSEPFQFDFVYGPTDERPVRQRVWIPVDLQSYVGHPHDMTQVSRTQGILQQASVTLTGYSTFRSLEAVLASHGVYGKISPTILDWGCGHGRVSRHFMQYWPGARIYGADIDPENVAWCSKNMSRGTFVDVPLMPPTSLPSDHFDALFGISVMTHLTEEVQQAWLAELRRILKPGGIALLTFGDASSAAWGSHWRTPEWWTAWERTGFDDGLQDPALDGKIGDDTYYRITNQSIDWTLRSWSRVFEVVSIVPDFVGNQSLAVLRRS